MTQLTIPNSVTTIDDSAFYNNKLTIIIIPNSVTTIGSHVFGGNNDLISIECNINLKEIVKTYFQEGTKLKEVDIENGRIRVVLE